MGDNTDRPTWASKIEFFITPIWAYLWVILLQGILVLYARVIPPNPFNNPYIIGALYLFVFIYILAFMFWRIEPFIEYLPRLAWTTIKNLLLTLLICGVVYAGSMVLAFYHADEGIVTGLRDIALIALGVMVTALSALNMGATWWYLIRIIIA